MLRFFLAIHMLLLCVLGCKSIIWKELRPVSRNLELQQTIFLEGSEVLVSTGTQSVVSVAGKKIGDGFLTFYIQYVNIASSHLNIDPTQIKIHAIDEKGDKRKLKVYSPKAYLKEAGNRFERSEKISLGLKSLKTSIDKATGQGTKKIGIIGYRGTEPVYGEVQDKQALKIDKEIIESKKKLIALREKEYLAEQESKLLKKNTIWPGNNIVGEVKVKKYNNVQMLILDIPAGTDNHILEFEPIIK